MNGGFKFTSNSEVFVRRVRKSEKRLFRIARHGLVRMKEEWINRMKKDHFSGYYEGKTRGKRLRNRHGALKASVGGLVSGSSLPKLRARLRVGGGRAGYATTQEYGATIRPKNRSGYLRIPLGPPGKALTPTGRLRSKAVPRPDGVTKKGNPKYTSGYGRTVIINKGGELFIIARPKRGRSSLLFVLRKQVRVPARLRGREEVVRVAAPYLDGIAYRFAKILSRGD